MKFFERYRLVEEVGSGTTGTVYRAFDPTIGRRVALKIVDPGWWGPNRKGRRGRLLHEAHIAGALLHPNIVTVYDFVEHLRKVGLVLEFIEGESLCTRIDRSGALPVADACTIANQVAAGLGHAHAHGIVHGDVKPANILLADSGAVKLTDFDLARLFTVQEGLARPRGTPRYMAPEQFGSGVATPSSDVYSLGAVLYEMLAGRPPFGGDTLEQIASQAMYLAPPPLSGIPPAVDAVVRKLLSKDPELRPADGGGAAEALRAAGAAEPFPTKPHVPVVAPQSSPARARNPTQSAGATTWLKSLASRSGTADTLAPSISPVPDTPRLLRPVSMGLAAMVIVGAWFAHVGTQPTIAMLPEALREFAEQRRVTVLRAEKFSPIAAAHADEGPVNAAISDRDLHRLAAIYSRIHHLHRRVATLRLHYTEAYPDVIAARREIRRLVSERRTILARIERNTVVDDGHGAPAKFTPNRRAPPPVRPLGRLAAFPGPGAA